MIKSEIIKNVEITENSKYNLLEEILIETKKRNKKTDKLSEFIATATPAKALSKAEEQQLAQLNKQIDKGQKILDSFLSVEFIAKNKVNKELNLLKKIRNRLEIRRLFPKLDRSFLKEKDKDNLPALVPFNSTFKYISFNDGKMIFTNGYRVVSSKNNFFGIPNWIDETVVDLEEYDNKNKSLDISCNFNKIIPGKTKLKIVLYEYLFNEIFIIDIPNWGEGPPWVKRDGRPSSKNKKRQEPVSSKDPILVGYDGEDLWLIDIFDGEPIEDVLSFTTPEEE